MLLPRCKSWMRMMQTQTMTQTLLHLRQMVVPDAWPSLAVYLPSRYLSPVMQMCSNHSRALSLPRSSGRVPEQL